MGEKRRRRQENIKNIAETVFSFLIFFSVTLFWNRDVKIHSLYMDDLANYWYYLRMGFLEYAFGVQEGQLYYRPVFFCVLYGICALITGHLERIVWINGVLQALIGTSFYRILSKREASKALSFGLSILALSSRLSYFNMGQMIGCIESLSILFALWILDAQMEDLSAGTGERSHTGRILLLYFLVSMTHERFIGLIVPVLLGIVLRKTERKQKITEAVFAVGEFLLILLIRFLTLGTLIPVGTSHTDVTETFTICGALKYAAEQVASVFGITIGPQYLTGLSFPDSSNGIKVLSLLGAFLMAGIILWYLCVKIGWKRQEPASQNGGLSSFDWRADLVILCSLTMYIASSSVTVRLEMRWVYVSYLAALLYGGMMISFLKMQYGGDRTKENKKSASLTGKRSLLLLSVLFFAVRLTTEKYYHSFYKNIFFYEDLIATNSLAENTVGIFTEEELSEKTVWLLTNEFHLSGKFWSSFYEPFFGKPEEAERWVINTVDWAVEQEIKRLEADGNQLTETEQSEIRSRVVGALFEDPAAVLLEEIPETRTYRIVAK